MRIRLLPVVLVAPLAFGAITATAGSAAASTTTLTAHARGTDELPKPGPAAATATATFTVDSASGKICYQLTATGLGGPATAAHIHQGAAGATGPHVVVLDPAKVNSGTETCVTAATALAAALVAHPATYYFNVHTAAFPDGAARGQLLLAPNGVNAGSGGGAGDGSPDRRLPVLAILTGAALLAVSSRRLTLR
ncbi:MAG: CHRD domain-containing protein [Frankiaceae bacterium]